MHRPPGLNNSAYNSYDDQRRVGPGTPSMQGSPTHHSHKPMSFDDPRANNNNNNTMERNAMERPKRHEHPPTAFNQAGRNQTPRSRQPTPLQQQGISRVNGRGNGNGNPPMAPPSSRNANSHASIANNHNHNGSRGGGGGSNPNPNPNPRGMNLPSTPQFEKISRGGMGTAGSMTSTLSSLDRSNPNIGEDDTVRVVVRIRTNQHISVTHHTPYPKTNGTLPTFSHFFFELFF